MNQIELELYIPNTDYIGKIISEEPYVKILGPIRWSGKYKSLVVLAQVETLLCFITINEDTSILE